jgi:branched-chain amino acid transport system ATP-binding protein
MLLDVCNLYVSYNAISAVSDVSFSVPQGTIVAIIGANGAGKSTILNAVSGLHPPKSGNILYRGLTINNLPPHAIVKRGIVQVPEGRGIFAPLTVQENLDIAAAGGMRKAIAEDFDRVFSFFPRLKERRKQLAGTLSGGEQQMLAVGRALLLHGDLLLLDEPSMGLSPGFVDTIFDIIVRINAEGKTILLIEQNAWKALSIAHTACVLETGRIVLSGTAEELRNNPRVKEAYLGA